MCCAAMETNRGNSNGWLVKNLANLNWLLLFGWCVQSGTLKNEGTRGKL